MPCYAVNNHLLHLHLNGVSNCTLMYIKYVRLCVYRVLMGIGSVIHGASLDWLPLGPLSRTIAATNSLDWKIHSVRYTQQSFAKRPSIVRLLGHKRRKIISCVLTRRLLIYMTTRCFFIMILFKIF